MNTIASTIASAHQQSPARPFGARKLVKADPKPADTSLFSICDDAPMKRTMGPGKYGDLFCKMQPGQALKVPATDASRVATAMSKWAKDNRPDCTVKHTTKYPGDSSKTPGRVWLLKREA